MKRKSFVSGAIILVIAGFFVRALGFVYRIYLSNLIGAEGMGLFQLISPIYSLIILTLTSGISIAVSKMVAEQAAKHHEANQGRITLCAVAMVLTAGIAVSALIIIKIDLITNYILKDPRTYYSIVFLIPCIPVIAAASALKGYFYGVQDVVPTAYSQIVEQLVRIGLVMLMAGYFVDMGLEYACALATVGMAVGEISNLAVLIAIYKLRKKKSAGNLPKNGLMRKRVIVREMLKITVPVSANRFITSIMAAIEFILIPRMLQAGGLEYRASIELYGRLAGMAMPLLFFPSIVTSSLATTLVPAISEAVSLKNYRSVKYRISKSIQISFLLGFIFMAIFIAYPNEIADTVYRRENIGWILYTFSFTCIFIYLQQTLLGILNGLGKQGISLRNSTAGYAIRIGFVYFAVPVYGINGYAVGVIISSACVCILNLITVVRLTGMTIDIGKWILKPGLIGVVMILIGKYIYSFFSIFISNFRFVTILAVACNLFVALFLSFISGTLEKDEMMRSIGLKKYQKTVKI